MLLIAIISIKIPTELATTLIVLSSIKISANFMLTALSIIISTEKSTKPIIKDKYTNFIIYQPLTIYAIARKSIFLTGSIKNGKAIKWQKNIIKFLKSYRITVLNLWRNN